MDEQNDISISKLGVHGNPSFPGEVSRVAQAYMPFPVITLKSGQTVVDRDAVKAEFMDAPMDHWDAFCSTKGWNPRGIPILPKDWQKEKRYRRSWAALRKDLEKNANVIGPKLLQQAVEAAQRLPEALSAMLELCRWQVGVYQGEAAKDQAFEVAKGRPPTHVERTFTASPGELAALSAAMKTTGEALYKSLGIDSAKGLDTEKWNRTIEGALGKLDSLDRGSENTEMVEVEIIGSADLRSTMKDAMARWMDKPMREVTPEHGGE